MMMSKLLVSLLRRNPTTILSSAILFLSRTSVSSSFIVTPKYNSLLFLPTTTSFLLMSSTAESSGSSSESEYYRTDGVKIQHNPYATGMAEKYGLPGKTDNEGFDPYADTVGAGIYGGSVERDGNQVVVMGAQYQNHNARPGPVYDGTGYSLMSRAIHLGPEKVQEILHDHPTLKNEISTGGATPLHMCGMSQQNQYSTQVLIEAGANMYAQDTYGYTALHRMASNNLDVGGAALVMAGQNPNAAMEGADSTPIEIAKRSRAIKFLMEMQKLGHYD
mmetsp:Transcript_8559/g.9180  ORF Transcript_8559/g.9180 Transcript_8559/m.9180 type:complete len:276 (+) Transcript_8559:118-945(+)